MGLSLMNTALGVALPVREIGRGAEGGTYFPLSHETNPEPSVIKAQEPLQITLAGITFHINWQSPWQAHYKKCAETYREKLIPIIKNQLYNGFLKLCCDGKLIETEVFLEVPFVQDIDALKLTYKDLVDAEKGPAYMRELVEIVQKADKIYKEDQLGLDPYGGEIVLDFLKGLKEILRRQIEGLLPKFISSYLRISPENFEGIVRNIIKLDDSTRVLMENTTPESLLGFIDLGMHDFSEKGKFQVVTKTTHHLMFGSLIEIIKRCIREKKAEYKISPEELEDLDRHFNGSIFEKKLSKFLVDLIFPLLEESV